MMNQLKGKFDNAMRNCVSARDAGTNEGKAAHYWRGMASAYADVLRTEYGVKAEYRNGKAIFKEA